MRLKLYRAKDIGSAMAQVRAELGPDALILGTRRIGEGIEVTAALESPEFVSVVASPARPPDPARETRRGRHPILEWHGVPGPLARSIAARQPARSFGHRELGFAPLPLAPGRLRRILLAGPAGRRARRLRRPSLATQLVLAGTCSLSCDCRRKTCGRHRTACGLHPATRLATYSST